MDVLIITFFMFFLFCQAGSWGALRLLVTLLTALISLLMPLFMGTLLGSPVSSR